MGKVASGVVIVLVVIVGLAFSFGKKDGKSEEAREVLSMMCAELPAYERRGDYIEELIDAHHDFAFEPAYRIGGRRTRASFDESAYLEDVLERMAKRADLDKMDKIAEQLRGLRNDVLGLPGD